MKKAIAVDFDGTLCENKYPKIGKANTSLIKQLTEEQEAGTEIILWTCRSGKLLREAVAWAKRQGLEFDYVNKNTRERIKTYKTDPRKISADVYIDDRAADFEFDKTLKL